MSLGVLAAFPYVLIPLYFPNLIKGGGDPDAGKPLSQRYWVKANLWIAIFSFIGNYVWTHYFYQLLGASYTFPAHRLNDVPVTLYLMTHAYFCLYHAFGNLMVRRARNEVVAFFYTHSDLDNNNNNKNENKKGQIKRPYKNVWIFEIIVEVLVVFVLSYATALAETVTIAHFPYYTFKDRERMYTVGSLFYAIYFFVSFPMFFRMHENTSSYKHALIEGKRPERYNKNNGHDYDAENNDNSSNNNVYTLWRVAVDALAAGMLVTLLLDFWRLGIGGIVVDDDNNNNSCGGGGSNWSLPWL